MKRPFYGEWSAAHTAVLKTKYVAGEPISAIAAAVDRSEHCVYRKAAKLGIHRPPKELGSGSLTRQVRELAARPGGMCPKDITDRAPGAVNTRAWDMCSKGLLFKRVLGYRNVRYYATAEAAAAAQPVVKAANPKKVPLKLRPGWGPNDPAVITSKTKVTIAPAPVRSLRTNTHQVF